MPPATYCHTNWACMDVQIACRASQTLAASKRNCVGQTQSITGMFRQPSSTLCLAVLAVLLQSCVSGAGSHHVIEPPPVLEFPLRPAATDPRNDQAQSTQAARPAIRRQLRSGARSTSANEARLTPSGGCPVAYERHQWQDVDSGEQQPYLFGGIYDRPACRNCRRGSLWPTWCNPKALTGQPFWDLQKCSAPAQELALQLARQQGDKGPLLMTPCDLFEQLKGRTLWIIGDSMSKDLYKALKCFMLEFWDLRSYQATSNRTAMHLLSTLPNYGEPMCVHLPHHTRICNVHAIQGDLFVNTTRHPIGVLPLLHEGTAQPHDFFVLNFGLWHGITARQRHQQHMHELGQFYASTRTQFPNVLWMETPKQHFDSPDGDYQVAWIGRREQGPWRCKQLPGVHLQADGQLLSTDARDKMGQYLALGTWRNMDAHAILRDTYGMPLLPIYNATAVMETLHRDNLKGHECSHFCHPSAPQLWVYQLHKVLQGLGAPAVELNRSVHAAKSHGREQVFERDEVRLGLPAPLDTPQTPQQQQQQQQQQEEVQQQQLQEQEKEQQQHQHEEDGVEQQQQEQQQVAMQRQEEAEQQQQHI